MDPLPERSVAEFTEALEAALADALPSDDPLDKTQFSALDFVNAAFPNEQSLINLDDFMLRLQARVRKLDEAILQNVRLQGQASEKGRADLAEARKAIIELTEKISGIQTRAASTEQMVEDLCRDIRTLDYAKNNLKATITTMNQLHMTVMGVEQLKQLAAERQYEPAADLVRAIRDLMESLSAYIDIPKVAELRDSVVAARTLVRKQVWTDLERYAQGEEGVSVALAHDACLVVDALGDDVRHELEAWFVAAPELQYREEFGSRDTLETADQRPKWIEMVMGSFHERFAPVVPPSWDVFGKVAFRLCELTRERITELLDAVGDAVNVNTLSKLMKAVRRLENYLNKAFPAPTAAAAAAAAGADQGRLSGARLSLERRQQRTGEAAGGGGRRFTGAVSSGFERSMTVYIKHEEITLSAAVDKLVKEERFDPDQQVCQSAQDLFHLIGRYMERCSDITTRQPLYDLSRAFAACLVKYADAIGARAASDRDRLSDLQLLLCVRTTDFCARTTEQLGEAMRRVIDAAFAEHINFSAAVEAFSTAQNRAIGQLVSLVEERIEPMLAAMTKTDWAAIDPSAGVSDESEYITAMARELRQVATAAGRGLSSVLFGFFCGKISTMVIQKYINSGVYKCKRLGPGGAQHLLLDTQTLKSVLLELPSLCPDQTPASGPYRRYIEREMGRTEAILKIMLVDESQLADQFVAMLPDGLHAELIKISELKGLKKSETQRLLEEVRARGGLQTPPLSTSSGAGPAGPATATAAAASGGKSGDSDPIRALREVIGRIVH